MRTFLPLLVLLAFVAALWGVVALAAAVVLHLFGVHIGLSAHHH